MIEFSRHRDQSIADNLDRPNQNRFRRAVGAEVSGAIKYYLRGFLSPSERIRFITDALLTGIMRGGRYKEEALKLAQQFKEVDLKKGFVLRHEIGPKAIHEDKSISVDDLSNNQEVLPQPDYIHAN